MGIMSPCAAFHEEKQEEKREVEYVKLTQSTNDGCMG